MLSWIGGPNLSFALNKLSMTIPPTYCHLFNAIPNCHWNNCNSALPSNRVLGSDIIPTEIYKVGGQPMTEKHSEFFYYYYCMWRKDGIPQEFNDVAITHTYERDMLKSVTAIEASLYCSDYCQEDTGQILLTRLHEYLDQVEILPVSQC